MGYVNATGNVTEKIESEREISTSLSEKIPAVPREKVKEDGFDKGDEKLICLREFEDCCNVLQLTRILNSPCVILKCPCMLNIEILCNTFSQCVDNR